MAAVTPLIHFPVVGFTLALPNNTTVVEANPAPYNNTKEVILYNPSAADRILCRFVDLNSPPALPLAATMTAATCIILPTQTALTLAIGPESCRQPMGTVAFWTVNGDGANMNLVFMAESGANLTLHVSYVQCAGGAYNGGW